MKKFLKTAAIIIIVLLLVLYLAFLFILPNVINLNKFMPEIKKIVAEQANLIVDIENPKIVTTPFLGVGLDADKISVSLPDTSELVRTGAAKLCISLPKLLFMTIKVTKAEIENPQVNIDIVNGKEYKITKYFEKNTSNNIAQDAIQTPQKPVVNPVSIKFYLPKLKLTNYAILINDIKTKDYLKLRGDEFLLGYKDGKSAYIKTNAELFVNEIKNIDANIDVDTFLPQPESKKHTTVVVKEPPQKVPFVNPVAVYKAYDLKTNIDSKIKLRQKNKKLISNGYFNIDNLTMNIGGLQLPESKLHIATKGSDVDIDSDLYVTADEKISVDGKIISSKSPSLDMNIKSTEIHLDNVLKLTKAALDSVQIQNNLSDYRGEGYFKADTGFKTDFKNLKSEGDISIYNCIVREIKTNKILTRVNSVISLNNSILRFIDTYVEIMDAAFEISGTIDETSNTDISICMEKMPLQRLVSLFAPSEIVKNYDIKSGDVDLNAKINGVLQDAVADVKLSLKNLSVLDKINNISYFNNLFTADFNSDFKTYQGIVNNSDFRLNVNGASVGCDKFTLSVDDKNIVMEPSEITINNSSIINFEGDIKNYINNPEFKIEAKGDLIAKDLKSLAGADIGIYLKEKGSLPFNLLISGDSKLQTIKASIDADKDNYITFADISNVLDKNTTMQLIVDLKSDSLKIKDTGLFIKNNSDLEEVVCIDGNITKLDTSNPSINLIKLTMPKELTGSISLFPQSELTLNGSILVSGDMSQPKVKGDLSVSNMSIPELLVSMRKATAKFEGKDLDVDISNFTANGSDFDVLMNADLTPSEEFIIRTLNLKSNYTDADGLMKVSDLAAKYTAVPSSGVSAISDAQPVYEAHIPVIIKDGSIDMRQIKSGDIKLIDTTAKISMFNDILYLNKLVTNAFKGKIFGDISMNVVSGEIKANVKGNGLDVEQTLLEAAAMKDTLTGTMDFDADISLKGATYEEQMSTLNGDVNFSMKNGSLGPMGKLENFVSADNIKNISILSNTLSSALKTTFDTSKYNTLKGHLSFYNGVAQINPITSSGDYMGAYIFGNFDILKNTADIKLRGKLSPKVLDSMGQLALLNPLNIVKSSSGMNPILAQLLLGMCEQVTIDELAQIPAVSKDSSDSDAARFQVVLRGDAAQPAKLVRSFKWLASEAEIQEAKSALGAFTIPTNTEQVKQQAKDLVKGILSDVKEETGVSGKNAGEVINSLLNSSSSDGTSLKDKLKQTQKNALQQLKEQAKNAVSGTEN